MGETGKKRRGAKLRVTTSVQFDGEQYDRLREAADEDGTSLAVALREAVDCWLSSRKRQPPPAEYAPAAA